ncbi:MAG: DUF6259 domain-containing protein [bacterium]
MRTIEHEIRHSLLSEVPIQQTEKCFKIEATHEDLFDVEFQFKPNKIIFPVREGELIEDPSRIAIGDEYSVTYPGTAATKCLVFYQDTFNILIGGAPSFDYAKITLKRVDNKIFHLVFTSRLHEIFLIPFEGRWEEAADEYKRCIHMETGTQPKRSPKYLLQVGVKNPHGEHFIRDFEELAPAIELFYEHFGSGNIVHFFGTNKDGFDRMFPDYTIDPDLGGEKSFQALIETIKSFNLLTSHHYNPRIADVDWMQQCPNFRRAIVKKNGQEVLEPYAGHLHYVMNPNDELWFARCFETVTYLMNLGFDYLEIDQFTYQRNFYDKNKPLSLGYKRMIEEFIRLNCKFWVEGVSDIFRLAAGNFYQILIRDRSQLWEDHENRRGYPYGRTFAEFFMYLYPDSEVSYQVMTENKSFAMFEERLKTARKINAAVYDLELGFYDMHYLDNLKKVAQLLGNHATA